MSWFNEEERLEELQTLLDELKRKGKFVDIQICLRCKGTRVGRVGSMSGDMLGQIASPKFECLDCGWRGRLRVYATNRPIDEKQAAVIASANLKDETDYR